MGDQQGLGKRTWFPVVENDLKPLTLASIQQGMALERRDGRRREVVMSSRFTPS